MRVHVARSDSAATEFRTIAGKRIAVAPIGGGMQYSRMAATTPAGAPVLATRVSGIGLAVAAMGTVQLGGALSKPLFDDIGPAGVVALRLALAGLILWPFRATPHPWQDARRARGRGCARRLFRDAHVGPLRGDLADTARSGGDNRVPRAPRSRTRRVASTT